MNNFIYSILLIISFLLISCVEEDNELHNEDLLFYNSNRLEINSYSFVVDSKEYLCQGDTMYFTEVPDTFPGSPVLQWDSLGFEYVTLAIFNERPVVLGNSIQNEESIVWQWHSGMNIGKEGRVKFIEGKLVENGMILYETTPVSLENGSYYWSVWGWDNTGTSVIYSSRIMEFLVNDLN